MSPNKTLEGHKLLVLTPWRLADEQLGNLRGKFPDLVISQYEVARGANVLEKVPEEEWEDTTILLSGGSLPPKEKVPRLQYVQLPSAGANRILEHPLFTETKVHFCTANGAHG